MTLSPDEAADRLRDIASVEFRSQRAQGYRAASPHLILWGILWAVGYGLTEPWPQRAEAIWTAIVAIGLVAGFALSLSRARRHDAAAAGIVDPTRRRAVARLRWRFSGIALTALAFITATVAVMGPVSGRQIGAFIPLVMAAGYAVLGLWRGPRFIIAGIVVAGLTLTGFFLLPEHFPMWMAAIGGGALILAGLWLREV
jgi:hypothetical protein